MSLDAVRPRADTSGVTTVAVPAARPETPLERYRRRKQWGARWAWISRSSWEQAHHDCPVCARNALLGLGRKGKR